MGRKRRLALVTLAGVAVLTGVLLNVEKRDALCSLCGKSKTVWALRLPPLEIGEEERENNLTRTLEPLVHANGSPHAWQIWDGSSQSIEIS